MIILKAIPQQTEFLGVGPLYSKLTRFQIITIFISVMLLRIGVGYHFYKEGTNKLTSNSFTSKYFLSGAKGPFAPFFHSMVEDFDGSQRLCIEKIQGENGSTEFKINHELTLAIWDDHLNRVTEKYDLGSESLQETFATKRQALADQIVEAREKETSAVDVVSLERERKQLEDKILQLRRQRKMSEEILEKHEAELLDWLAANEVELLGYFRKTDRLDGFERDGENRDEAALYVESIRWQVDSIRSDRKKKLGKWSYDVTKIWDSFEEQIQSLAIEEQIDRAGVVRVHRPFDEPYSFYKVVDKVIPWFDTLVGVSLILGLFTRVSSLAAAAFLFSVIMTQPPWIPGTDPNVIFYILEFLACLVIFATNAGLLGGLDFFIQPWLFGRRSGNPGAVSTEVSTNVAESDSKSTSSANEGPKGQLA